MYVCFNLFYAFACALNSALVDIMYVLINLLIIAAFYIFVVLLMFVGK